MRSLRVFVDRIARLFRGARYDREFAAELDAHLQMQVDANLRAGLTREQALRAARLTLGGLAQAREERRRGQSIVWIEDLRADLRCAARTIRRSPTFAVTVIAVIALGIGATTATFAILDHVLLRPLPFPDSHRLVRVFQSDVSRGVPRLEASPPNFLDWRASNQTFSSIGSFLSGGSTTLLGHGEPRQIETAAFDADVLPTLGVRALIGRGFAAADQQDNAAVVILSYHFAVTLFGDAVAAMNQVVNLDGRPHTVVGVMPPDFAFPSRGPVLWAPMLSFDRLGMMRTNLVLNVIARLRSGVSIEQARADMNLIAAQLRQAYPNDNAGVSISVIDLHELLLPQSRLLVVTVFAAAFCLLVIVCTNVANLLLARAVARRHEMAVRAAIGAGSWRLIKQLLTESALLAIIGGIAGAAMAVGAVPLIARLVPAVLPVATAPAVDGRILLFAGLVTFCTSIAVGLVPALRPSRTTDPQSLRSRVAPASSGRLRSALVVTEIAVTATLLVAAGLLVKALWRVQSVDVGFHADGVLTLRTNLPTLFPGTKYRDALTREQFYNHVLTGASALPGVVSAAYTTGLPLVLGAGVMMVTVPGTVSNPATAPRASIRFVTPQYFATMRIPLRRGRFVDERDSATAPPAVTISESLAQALWPGQDPIGRPITIFTSTRTVVGVAGDIVVRGLERTSEPQIYLSMWQPSPFSPFYAPRDLVVRAQVDARTLAPAIRAIIHEADPDQPVADVRLFDDILALQTASRREQIVVLGLFAGLASLLAAVGMYGLLSYAVSARTQEVGVRVALGAGRGTIARLFLQQGVVLGAVGIAIAMPLAYAGGRAIDALLFGLSPADPPVYLAAAGLAAIITLTASLVPALRAATINPAMSIRAE